MSSRPLRIVHATSVHRADDGRIFERQCRSLAASGHMVTLLAAGTERRRIDGVDVIGIGRSDGRLARMVRLVNSIARRIREDPPDIVVLHDPELLRLLVMPWRGPRPAMVYDAHEDYRAQMRDKEWLPQRLRGVAATMLGGLELLGAARADLVLCATPTIAERFRDQRTEIVLNRPLTADLASVDTISEPVGGVGQVCYVGDLRTVRGAESLVDAMEIVNRHRPARLDIAGRITPESLEQDLAQRAGWEYVRTLGWQTRADVYELIANADVATLPFLAAENHVSSQPNKLFEYMMMGVPIVASDFEQWRSLAAEADARLHPCEPGDASSIAEQIIETLDTPTSASERRSAAIRARRVFSWESVEDDYVAIMESLPGSATTP